MVRGKQTARKSSAPQIRRPESEVTDSISMKDVEGSLAQLPELNVDFKRLFENVAKMKYRNDAEILARSFVSHQDWSSLLTSPLPSLTSEAIKNFANAASYITRVMGEGSQEAREKNIELFKSTFGSALLSLQAASSIVTLMMEEEEES